MNKHVVCKIDELPPGSKKKFDLNGKSLMIVNVKGEYFAIRNVCPHQSASLCDGTLRGTMLPSNPGEYEYGLEDKIISCPWHGWEFDVTTGKSLFEPEKVSVKTYDLTIENDYVVIKGN